MNRNHLALFQAVASAGGITAAAERLRVSQPAVSKQIAELEAELGLRLLDRLPRGCRLTEAGRILAEYADRLHLLENDAARAIEEYRGLKQGRISIGASLTIGAYLLPEVLTEFHRLYPKIELQLQSANTTKIERSLIEGSLELGLTEGPSESEEVESKVFFQDELVVIAPIQHPLLKKKKVTLQEICKEPFLLREEGSGTRAVVERSLRRHGFKIRPILSLGSPAAIKNMVAAGMGLSIVSRLIVDLEVKSGSLGIVPVQNLRITRPLHLQRIRSRQQSPAILKFQELLRKKTSFH